LTGDKLDLFEYQARDLFESHQIPVLAGAVATTPEEAESIALKIWWKSCCKSSSKNWWQGQGWW